MKYFFLALMMGLVTAASPLCAQSWHVQNSGTTMMLCDVSFSSTRYGWAVGYVWTDSTRDRVLIHTTDGGITWLPQDVGIPNSYSVYTDVCFPDDSTGWVAAFLYELWKTTNGGITWTREPIDTTFAPHIMDIEFTDRNHGWLVAAPWASAPTPRILMNTTNSGRNWSQQFLPGTPPLVVESTDSLHAWIGGENWGCARSTDGGMVWDTTNDFETADIRGLDFTDSLYGWAVGWELLDGLFIVHTTDGGREWELQDSYSDYAGELDGVAFVDRQNGWAVGRGGWTTNGTGLIVHTTNGGENWLAQTIPTTTNLHAVCFVDSVHGWAVGDSGTILFYGNSVNTPQQHSVVLPLNCRLSAFPNPFNASTVLLWSLPVAGDVQLNVYDCTGRLAAHVLEMRTIAGEHSTLFDASMLPSGIYFARLQTGKFQAVQKLVLMK